MAVSCMSLRECCARYLCFRFHAVFLFVVVCGIGFLRFLSLVSQLRVQLIFFHFYRITLLQAHVWRGVSFCESYLGGV